MSGIITFSIGNVEIHGRPDGLAPPDGIYLGPGGADAWWESVDVVRDVVPRATGVGSFDTPGRLADRTLPFSGIIASPSEGETERWCSLVRGILADGSMGVVSDGKRIMRGRLTGRTRAVPRRGNRKIADWLLTVWCPDPRKYGETEHFTAGEPAHHEGNFTALPVLTVTGSRPGGYTITGPDGRQFVVAQPLVAGQPHEIRMRDGLVRIGGAVVPGAALTPTTWGIPAGAQVVHQISDGLSLDVAVTTTDI